MCVLRRFSCVRLFATLQTVAHQASLSMELSRQKYWSGLPFPSPEELPNPGIEPWAPASQAGFYHLSYRGPRINGTVTAMNTPIFEILISMATHSSILA